VIGRKRDKEMSLRARRGVAIFIFLEINSFACVPSFFSPNSELITPNWREKDGSSSEKVVSGHVTGTTGTGFEPEILAFLFASIEHTARRTWQVSMRLNYPTNVKIVKRFPVPGGSIFCFILKAFESGVDGVYSWAGCLEGECHFLRGTSGPRKRVQYVKTLLDEVGLGQAGRVEMYNMSSSPGSEVCRGRRVR